jgi:hypothetical protein
MPAYSYKEVVIDHIRGDYFECTFLIGEDFPLAGKKIKAQVRSTQISEPAVLEFLTEDNSITYSATDHTVTFIKKATLMDIPAGGYVFDVQFYTNADDIITLFGGRLNIKQDVTR